MTRDEPRSPERAPGYLIKPPIMSARRFPILVATSVSEWTSNHSLTLVATLSKPQRDPGNRPNHK